MPQLNPAPWFFNLLITWITIFVLLKHIVTLYSTTLPVKPTLLHKPITWLWTWL